MNQPGPSVKPRILIAPLDWGLGHVTRCIPIIHSFLKNGCTVLLAGNGRTRSLLRSEFAGLPFADLEGYGISYSRNGWLMPLVMTAQIPKIIAGIKYENERVRELIKEHQIDALFSDNRYGFYHPGLPSVFMGHQLQIRTGMGSGADAWLRKVNYRYLRHFTECWIPDYPDAPGLAGVLSHPAQLPEIPLHYLGPLSRFHETGQSTGDYLLFLLSGPEPQRTILENIFLRELEQYKGRAILVSGLPEGGSSLADRANLQVFSHLGAQQLEEKIAGASMVIARSGYSTIMDLAVMRKKAILIPTPGQTEQEYLARHQMENHSFLCIPQSKFRLQPALALAESFPFSFARYPGGNKLDMVVKQFVSTLVPSI